MFTELRERFSYDTGHQWRLPRRAGDFDFCMLTLSWAKGGVTLHVALLGLWVAVHYFPAVDEWEAA